MLAVTFAEDNDLGIPLEFTVPQSATGIVIGIHYINVVNINLMYINVFILTET